MEWGPAGPCPRSWKPNQVSALAHAEWVTAEVARLVQDGAVIPVPYVPWVVNPLGVVTKRFSDKLRLVLDQRVPNKYLADFRFKLERLANLSDLARRADCALSVDLTQGYQHVDLANPAGTLPCPASPTGERAPESAREYCGFEWRGQYYVYTVLPFGLKTAPRVFSKCVGLMVRHWRRAGVRMLAYLDDWLFLTPKGVVAQRLADRIRTDCAKGGIAINEAKSQLVAVRRLKHLGFIVDFVRGSFEIPEDRWSRLHGDVRLALGRTMLRARKLNSIAGQIESFGLATGGVSRLFTRAMKAAAEAAVDAANGSWNAPVLLTDDVRDELIFWSLCDRESFRGAIFPAPEDGAAVRFACDASDKGWGALSLDPSALIAHGFFKPEEREESSTHRELRGLLHALRAFARHCAGRRVSFQVDNLNVTYIVDHGSRKPALNWLAKEVHRHCAAHDIVLALHWVPRYLNQAADDVSKLSDKEDWMLSKDEFRRLDAKWGTHDVDLFASQLNALCPVFYTKHHCPGSAGVDAFLADWSRTNNWINPPFSLIGRVISKLRADRAVATLIVPQWTGRYWWPLIAPQSGVLADFVTDWEWLPRRTGLFCSGELSGNAVDSPPPAWGVLALRVDFRADVAARRLAAADRRFL